MPDQEHENTLPRDIGAELRVLVDNVDRTVLSRKLTAGRTAYQIDPNGSGAIERIEPNGRRTLGHMVNRHFVPLENNSGEE